jgi:hypothetical protein
MLAPALTETNTIPELGSAYGHPEVILPMWPALRLVPRHAGHDSCRTGRSEPAPECTWSPIPDLTLLGHIPRDMRLRHLETSGRIRLSTLPRIGSMLPNLSSGGLRVLPRAAPLPVTL